MSEAKHTPGPWHWDSDPVKGDPLNRVRYRVTTIGKTVTQCYYSSSDPQAEWDARLIAAAPDLLEKLVAARKQLPIAAASWNEEPQYAAHVDSVLALIGEIDALLAKATGAA